MEAFYVSWLRKSCDEFSEGVLELNNGVDEFPGDQVDSVVD